MRPHKPLKPRGFREIYFLTMYTFTAANIDDRDGCIAANYHCRNYQAHRSFAITGEEEEH
jgi:hypothetical protein